MFAGEIVQNNATVRQYLPDAKSSFLTAFARHDLGAEGNRHFGTRPNAFGDNFTVKILEKSHI